MINPNKNYFVSRGYIRKINSEKILVEVGRAGKVEGFTDLINFNYRRFKRGDRVNVWVRFSILNDCFVITKITKCNLDK